ncbi:acyl-CoA dehydrogenase family protein [Pseudonocardia sp. KRD291]|uniref:acyl-CoA dehydrogenase family protein n=1 Tax=Pseudonocardia sp. KRD291 TaxID=2792007 RepID=UPI001C4A5550|nr:acyl-CoA dehydrogenase family protein [Pseudonocardia sp. KRD291]MBW0102654.1 acyl-CoA dehydrogenase [Pseudonocardia sp. KRD291]
MADDEYGAAVDEYLTRAYDGDRLRELLDAGAWHPELAAELAGLGWYSLAVPEDRGGLGAPLSALGAVFVQFGRHLVVGPQLENVLVPALLADERVAAVVETGVPVAVVDHGVTEEWAEDLGSVTLTSGRLSGTVHAVRFARQASLLVVIAGAAVCLVDPAAPGVRIDELDSADPGTEFARVVLDEVPADPIPDDDLVARLRSWAMLLLACELSGLAHRSLEHTVEHIGRREQFGRPVGSFQALQHIAADMHMRWTGLHNLCLATLADADEASVSELAIMAATAKAHAAEVAVSVCEDAIQLHGGMGFTTESVVSRHYTRALALRAWYGDQTELRRRIGASLLHETDPRRTT